MRAGKPVTEEELASLEAEVASLQSMLKWEPADDRNVAMLVQLSELRALNADLLTALKRLVEVGCCAGEGVIEAEAAIAKAEGRK